MKYSFLNDYSEGCHPTILQAFAETNDDQATGYGADDFSESARDLLRDKCYSPDASIHFVTGGTQANLLCIAACLKPFEAVIAPETGHIAANEAGAIEATGHKIITVPSVHGKLTPEAIHQAVKQFSSPPHMVRAKLVYISNATEMGTVYSLAELTALSDCCRENGLYLLMDGARLGMAFASDHNDLTLADIAALTDIFWLGGTKMGALFGEAIVITNDELKSDFPFHLKQRGALLAKGRALGIQFQTLLNDDLYLSLSRHANTMAKKLADGLVDAGFSLAVPTESNQIFARLPAGTILTLSKDFDFYEWEKCKDGTSVVRLVTSWATSVSAVDKFIQKLG